MATHLRPRIAESVIKQGYLKKTITSKDFIPSAPQVLANSILQKLEPQRWYVFAVSYSKPYLEYYDKEETVFSGRAVKRYDLSTFKNLTYTLGRTNTTFTFCIFLENEIIELTAPNRAQMVEWCRCIEVSLRNLGYRGKFDRDDHTYSAFPTRGPLVPASAPIVDDPEGIYFTGPLAEDHIYSDPLDAVDGTTDESTTPKVMGAGNSDDTENVFASLYSVTRDTLTQNSVTQPIYDFGISPVEESKEHVTDPANTVAKEVDKDADVELLENEPQQQKPLESDTSGDSDFNISTSFWMRNRRFSDSKDDSVLIQRDKDTSRQLPPLPNPLYDYPPPPVPVHQRSKGVGARSRNCFSLVVNSSPSDRSVSPTLLELDNAPHVPDLINLYSLTKTEDSVVKARVPDTEINNNVQEITHSKLSYPNMATQKPDVEFKDHDESNSKRWVPDMGDDIDGTYEELSPGTQEPSSRNSAAETHADEYENVYETSWGVKGTSNFQESDLKELVVDLPKNDPGKLMECNSHPLGQLASGSNDDVHKGAEEKHAKKKSTKSFFHSFKKSSTKYKELPESLTIDQHNNNITPAPPSSNCYATENNANELVEKTGNVYSDFPLDEETSPKSPEISTHSLETSPMSPAFESDILKEAQVANPIIVPHTSPVLPKRTNFRHSARMAVPADSIQTHGANCESHLNTDCKLLDSTALISLDHSSTEVHENGLPVAPPRYTKKKENSKQSKHAIGNKQVPSVEETEGLPDLPPRPRIPEDKELLIPKNDSVLKSKLHDTAEVPVSLPTERDTSPLMPKRILKNTEAQPSPNFSEHPLRKSQPVAKPRASSQTFPAVLEQPDQQKPALPPRVRSMEADDIPAPLPPKRGVMRSVTSLDETRRDQYAGVRTRPSHLSVRQQLSAQAGGLTVMNLKQNQVDILRAEIESTGGLVLTIPKVHMQHGLALVECFERLWIAGWDVKKYPRLYDKFHIGDEILAVNDVRVSDLAFTQKLMKNIKADVIELTVRRLPNANAYAIQRGAEGESLGFRREGGTAEIVYVDPNGLANRHGLINKCTMMDGEGLCSWMLTEINNRPINLFFKDQEIEHRLLAVGRDISIVVQPSDFIRELKKQLKKIRSYKDYVVQ